MSKAFLLILIIALALTACAGDYSSYGEPEQAQVVPLPWDIAVAGMQTVLNNGFGTFILEGEQYVLLAWPDIENYNYVILSKASETPIKDLHRCCEGLIGNQVGQFTMADLVRFLKDNKGWKYVNEPPEHIQVAIQHAVQWMALNWAKAMPTIFIVPVGPLKDALPEGNIRT